MPSVLLKEKTSAMNVPLSKSNPLTKIKNETSQIQLSQSSYYGGKSIRVLKTLWSWWERSIWSHSLSTSTIFIPSTACAADLSSGF